MTIWKYPLETTEMQFLFIPRGAKMLSVQMYLGKPCIWALVNPDADKGKRHIRIYSTGHRVDERFVGEFIGTYQFGAELRVFHVFDIGDVA